MIYSKENLAEIIFKNKQKKRKTYIISIALLLVAIICAILVFVLKSLTFAILGFIISLVAFSYFFYNLDVPHKKMRSQENFYADIVYCEKSIVEVEFLCLDGSVVSSKKTFNQIKVYNFKTESVEKVLVEETHKITMEQNKRYILTLSNNILVDYKGV